MAARTTPPWLFASAMLVALLSAAMVISWLEQNLAPGAGWLWLWLSVALGGVGVDLLRRRYGMGSACATGPQVRPLQVSCLALQASGVVLYQGGQNPAFVAALPMLSAAWLPLLCIVGGMLGLGVLSVSCSCRDAELHGRV